MKKTIGVLMVLSVLMGCNKEKSSGVVKTPQPEFSQSQLNPLNDIGVIHNDFLDAISSYTYENLVPNHLVGFHYDPSFGIDSTDFSSLIDEFIGEFEASDGDLEVISMSLNLSPSAKDYLIELSSVLIGEDYLNSYWPSNGGQDSLVVHIEYLLEKQQQLIELEQTILNDVTFLSDSNRTHVLTAMTIAKHSHEYWTEVFRNAQHPFHELLMDKFGFSGYNKFSWRGLFEAVAIVACADVVGGLFGAEMASPHAVGIMAGICSGLALGGVLFAN